MSSSLETSEDETPLSPPIASFSSQKFPSLPQVRNSLGLKGTPCHDSSSSNEIMDDTTILPSLLPYELNNSPPSQVSSANFSLPPSSSVLCSTSILYPPSPQSIPPGTTLSKAPPYVHVKIISVKKDLSEGRESLSFEICTKVSESLFHFLCLI